MASASATSADSLPPRRAARPARPTAYAPSTVPRFHGLAGDEGDAVQHRDARALGTSITPAASRIGGMPASRWPGCLAAGQVIDRQHGVGLAAAEGGLQLDDRLAALPAEAPHHRVSSRRMPSVMKVRWKNSAGSWYSAGPCRVHRGDVGGELGLLEGALQHVGVGDGDLSPGFHACSSAVSNSSMPLRGRQGRVRRHLDVLPAGDHLVVSAGILGPALALAEGVEPIGELAHPRPALGHARQERRRPLPPESLKAFRIWCSDSHTEALPMPAGSHTSG